MGRARPAKSVAAVVTVLLISVSACGGGKVQYVDDVARELATGSHSSDELARELKAANGGKSKLGSDLVEGFTSSKAVEALLDASKEAAGLACTAWENGLEEVVSPQLIPLSVQVEAGDILTKMRAESDDAKIAAITAACNFESVASAGF